MEENRQLKWDKRFVELARHISDWSKDPSTKVGAVITDSRRIVCGVGYNGFPRGVDDAEDRYNDRTRKYPRVVHAELNAILNSTVSLSAWHTIHVTYPPCNDCAKAIIQSRIGTVIVDKDSLPSIHTPWGAQWIVSAEMFHEAGVTVRYV